VIRDGAGIEEERPMLDARSSARAVYPSPARTFLAVHLPPATDCPTVEIFDVSGELIGEVATAASATRNDEVRVSLNGISPGIYFLRLGTDVRKFLVVR